MNRQCDWNGEAVSIWQWTALNLDRLAIKASTASNAADAVVLSSGGRVWTTYICSGTTLSDGTCKKVSDLLTSQYTHALTIKWEGTAVTTFNQASAASLDIVGGTNVTVTPDATNNKITISANWWWGGGWNWSIVAGGSDTTITNSTTDVSNPYINYVENSNVRSSLVLEAGSNTTIKAKNGKITISANWGWGDGYRDLINLGQVNGYWVVKALKPTQSYIYTNEEHLPFFVGNYYDKAAIDFSSNWIKIGQEAADAPYVWLSVAQDIIVGNGDNRFYFFASWNASSTTARYEISATKRLKIGVDSGAFLYFQSYQNTGSNNSNGNNLSQYKIWVNRENPKATLDIQWSIRIDTNDNSCAIETCNSRTRWTIIFRAGYFYGCTNDGWIKFSGTSVANTANLLPVSTNCAITSMNVEEYVHSWEL